MLLLETVESYVYASMHMHAHTHAHVCAHMSVHGGGQHHA